MQNTREQIIDLTDGELDQGKDIERMIETLAEAGLVGAASDLAGLEFSETSKLSIDHIQPVSQVDDTLEDALSDQFVPTKEVVRISELSQSWLGNDIDGSSGRKQHVANSQDCSTSSKILAALDKSLTVPIDSPFIVFSTNNTLDMADRELDKSNSYAENRTTESSSSYTHTWNNQSRHAQDLIPESGIDGTLSPSGPFVTIGCESLPEPKAEALVELRTILSTNVAQIENIMVNPPYIANDLC